MKMGPWSSSIKHLRTPSFVALVLLNTCDLRSLSRECAIGIISYIYYSKKVLHHQIFTKIYKYHFFLSIPNLNFKFDTALEDSIQYLIYECNYNTTINLFGNIMWKSVKLHFSVSTNIWDFLKVSRFFQGFRIQFCFQILTLEVEKYRFKPKSEK